LEQGVRSKTVFVHNEDDADGDYQDGILVLDKELIDKIERLLGGDRYADESTGLPSCLLSFI
jgi:hypothetical protein